MAKTVFWDVMPCSLVETNVSEQLTGFQTSLIFYQTIQHNIPEDSNLHTCCHENMKFHQPNIGSGMAYSPLK
jgi:hypothetical protein